MPITRCDFGACVHRRKSPINLEIFALKIARQHADVCATDVKKTKKKHTHPYCTVEFWNMSRTNKIASHHGDICAEGFGGFAYCIEIH